MEDTASLLALADRMLWITALVAAPILIASLAVGLVVGVVIAIAVFADSLRNRRGL